INFVGKLAIEVVKAYATGGKSLTRSARAKNAIKDVIESTAKDFVTDRAKEILDDEGVMSDSEFEDLVDWIKTIQGDGLEDKIMEELGNALGIDPKWLTFDVEPADFAPVASDTYAKIKGNV
ncbi:hypothetical protein RZS08_29590, partial [Arthrospira platensis SPKY1]|nr:hypothetical protein [Arthrospira platensis SPKY1]